MSDTPLINFNNFEQMDLRPGITGLAENPLAFIDFQILRLTAGETWANHSHGYEIGAIILGGRCRVSVGSVDFGEIGERPDVFSGRPYVFYVPPHSDFQIAGVSEHVEIAFCRAKEIDDMPAAPPILITPADIDAGVLGTGNYTRTYHNVPFNSDPPIHRLEIGETYTPSGNWSTYPPHTHEIDQDGREWGMEEICFYRMEPSHGFGMLKHYTKDGRIDAVYTVREDTVFKVRQGYHPYVSAPGYCGYHLWFHGGEARGQRPLFDSDHTWLSREGAPSKSYCF